MEEFEASLNQGNPPIGVPVLIAALWWDTRGDWQKAHAIAQDIETREGAWVHAYLHRREGDPGNAAYWYQKAQKPVSREPLDAERKAIVIELLTEKR